MSHTCHRDQLGSAPSAGRVCSRSVWPSAASIRRRARIIPNIFRAVTGQLDHVTLNGEGSAVRDFVHVADVATAIPQGLAACTPGVCPTINLGSGTGTSMATVVATAEQITGHPVTVHRQPPKPEPPNLIADISRAQALLGWTPAKSKLSDILTDAWEAWPRS